MNDEFEITWEVQDGYVNNGPHHLTLSTDDIDDQMGDKDLSAVFEDAIREDFINTVTWSSDQEAEFIEWAKKQIAKMKEESK